jgi:hypothetical protein
MGATSASGPRAVLTQNLSDCVKDLLPTVVELKQGQGGRLRAASSLYLPGLFMYAVSAANRIVTFYLTYNLFSYMPRCCDDVYAPYHTLDVMPELRFHGRMHDRELPDTV